MISDRDRSMVAEHLGVFIRWMWEHSPNSAVGDNAQRAAHKLVAEAREEGRLEHAELESLAYDFATGKTDGSALAEHAKKRLAKI